MTCRAAGIRAQDEAGAEAIAARLADAKTMLVIASGADRPAARSWRSRSRRPRAAVDDARPRDVFCTATCPQLTNRRDSFSSSPTVMGGRIDSPGPPGPRRGSRPRPPDGGHRRPRPRRRARDIPHASRPAPRRRGAISSKHRSRPSCTATPLQLLTSALPALAARTPNPIRRDDPALRRIRRRRGIVSRLSRCRGVQARRRPSTGASAPCGA